MSMESDLFTLLKTACVRVFPDVAPAGTALPYVTWQAIGGKTLRAVNGAALDKRNTLMQINAWATTRTEARTIIQAIEDAMCASASFTADPESEPLSSYEDDTKLYGSTQRFSIHATR